MRVGTVQLVRGRLRPIVRVLVLGQNNASWLCRATVDTGFSEHLTLPGDVINYLGLQPAGSTLSRLANDEIQRFELYHAEIFFGGHFRNIQVHRTETESLMGMSLISGNIIKIDARVGGAVEMEAPQNPVQ